MCSRTFFRSIWNTLGSLNFRGSRLAAPRHSMITVPARMGTPPKVVVLRASRKSTLVGLCMRSASSMKDRSDPVSAQALLQFGLIPEDLHGRAEQFGNRLLARCEQERGRPHYL